MKTQEDPPTKIAELPLTAFELPKWLVEPAVRSCRLFNTALDFIFYNVPTLRVALAEKDAPMQARGEKPSSRPVKYQAALMFRANTGHTVAIFRQINKGARPVLVLTNTNSGRQFRCRLPLSTKRQALGPGGYRGRRPQCPLHQSLLRLFTRIETVSA